MAVIWPLSAACRIASRRSVFDLKIGEPVFSGCGFVRLPLGVPDARNPLDRLETLKLRQEVLDELPEFPAIHFDGTGVEGVQRPQREQVRFQRRPEVDHPVSRDLGEIILDIIPFPLVDLDKQEGRADDSETEGQDERQMPRPRREHRPAVRLACGNRAHGRASP